MPQLCTVVNNRRRKNHYELCAYEPEGGPAVELDRWVIEGKTLCAVSGLITTSNPSRTTKCGLEQTTIALIRVGSLARLSDTETVRNIC